MPMTPRSILMAVACAAGLLGVSAPALAEDGATVTLSVKDHKFQPAEARAAANKAFTIVVKNLDATPIEFESKTLRVEKVIAGGAEASIRMRALAPGKYKFFDEYNEKTAQGVLVVE